MIDWNLWIPKLVEVTDKIPDSDGQFIVIVAEHKTAVTGSTDDPDILLHALMGVADTYRLAAGFEAIPLSQVLRELADALADTDADQRTPMPESTPAPETPTGKPSLRLVDNVPDGY